MDNLFEKPIAPLPVEQSPVIAFDESLSIEETETMLYKKALAIRSTYLESPDLVTESQLKFANDTLKNKPKHLSRNEDESDDELPGAKVLEMIMNPRRFQTRFEYD